MTTQEEKNRKQKKMMDYYQPDVENEIGDITNGNAHNFREHVNEVHLNVNDGFLMHRIIEDKDIDAASSILGIDDKELCSLIGKYLAKPDVMEEVLEYLTWPKSDWAVSKDYPAGTPYYLWMPMPEGVSGHKYERSHNHNWDDGPIICDNIQITIIRSEEYVEEKMFSRNAKHRPFIIMTAFSV